jgi:dihydropteroate synthase
MGGSGDGGTDGPADRRTGGQKKPAPTEPRHVLFVTGKLAEPALRRVLAEMKPAFAFEVAVLRITVAALMTTDFINRLLLSVPAGTDLVLLPGLSEADPAALAARLGVRVEKGPKDLREIPQYFGRQALTIDYGAWDIEILAEINNAVRLERGELIEQAEYFRSSGADIIDIGCTPGVPFPELGAVVAELVGRGMRVSVDSFIPSEIRTAVMAGAELVLSINGSNRELIPELAQRDVRVVAIPDFGEGLETLDPTIAELDRAGVRYLIDPIVEPIGFGFLTSLERFADARRRWPEAPLMMGIGNITELTAADSTGVNAILIAICQEVGVKAVLTTEVIPWARGSVREIDVARRLMYYAIRNREVPKRIDDRLVTLKDPKILVYSEAELRELQAQVTDPNFRIFTDRDTITVFNHERFVRGTDPMEIFAQLGVDEATHAFYLGRELMKAKTAITLGKTYRQEGALNWGYLTPADDVKSEHVKLTQRSAKSLNAKGAKSAKGAKKSTE